MTKEELYNYYIVEKHTRADTAMFFNVTEDQLKYILSKYRIVKKQRGVIHPVMWTVYRHVNKINGKSYIGITCQRYEQCRWGYNGHGYNQYGQKKFWNAIRKYGWNNFDHEILEKNIPTPEKANEKEKYWIEQFDSFKNGYNATIGGSGATGHKVNEKARKKMGEANIGSKHHTQKHSEESKRLMSERQKGKHSSPRTEFKKGEHHGREFKKGLIPWNKSVKTISNAVLQYDLQGNFIREWKDTNTAIVFYNGSILSNCIGQCCNGNKKTYKGFLWRYKENENYPLKIEPPVLIDVRKSVLQYDLNGNFIAEYESTIEAHRQTGAQRGIIRDCCLGKYKQAGGYIWRYKK